MILKKKNIKEHNPNWSQILDHPYRLLIIRCYGSGKTNSFFNLIWYVTNKILIKFIYMFKIPMKQNINQLSINNRKSKGLKHLKLSLNTWMIQMIFIKILKNIIQIRNAKDWSEILSNKKRNPAVIELFTKGRKLNISLASIMQSCFAGPKIIWLNSTHHFILKIPNK